MMISSFLDLFHNRQTSTTAHLDWLAATNAHITRLDESLLATQPFDLRRALSYSAYCFWYAPLLSLLENNPALRRKLPDPLKDIAQENLTPWTVSELIMALTQIETEATHKALQETSSRLYHNTRLFASVRKADKGYAPFQEALTQHVRQRLQDDVSLEKHAALWPKLSPEEWHAIESRACLSPDFVAKLQEADASGFAKKITAHLFNAAKDLRPTLFAALPPFRAYLLDSTIQGGTYFYNPTACGFAFGVKNIYTLRSAAHLALGCLHEGEHLLQSCLAHNCDAIKENDSLKEMALLFADELRDARPSPPDFPISFYSSRCVFPPLHAAYKGRFSEFFAFKSGAIYERALLSPAGKHGVLPRTARAPRRPSPPPALPLNGKSSSP